jgi:Na+-driven multidrug efflux pump
MIKGVGAISALSFGLTIIILSQPIVNTYSDSEAVAAVARPALCAFAIAWFFDFTQC